jgi:hypothetical protein
VVRVWHPQVAPYCPALIQKLLCSFKKRLCPFACVFLRTRARARSLISQREQRARRSPCGRGSWRCASLEAGHVGGLPAWWVWWCGVLVPRGCPTPGRKGDEQLPCPHLRVKLPNFKAVSVHSQPQPLPTALRATNNVRSQGRALLACRHWAPWASPCATQHPSLSATARAIDACRARS